MKTNLVIKICLICLAVVAVTFLVLKLTLWKTAPKASLKDLKKGTNSYYGSKANDSKKTGKNIEKTHGAISGSNRSNYESVPVEAIRVKRDDIEIFLVNNFTLEAEKQVDVTAKASGIVLQILAEEGDYVESGKPLAKLDDKEALLALRDAKLKNENAERIYKSSLDNFKDAIISKDELEDKKFQFEITSVELEKKQLEYEYTTIESPIDGVIVERNIDQGYNIEEGEMVFKIADFDPILARIFIPEKDINKVAVGQTAKIVSEFIPEKEFLGKVKIVSPIVDPDSGTVKVTIEIKHLVAKALKPGMFVSVYTIVDRHKDALSIPKKALILEAETDEVFIAQDFILMSLDSDQTEGLTIGNHVKCILKADEGATGNSIHSGKIVDISSNYEDESINNITIETIETINPNVSNVFEKVSFYNNQDILLLQTNGIGFKVETKAFRAKITLGFKEGNHVEVLTGLKESDRVITVGQDDVSHGANITIMNEEM
jgi:membrane fusion protein (multidrug efflux system)